MKFDLKDPKNWIPKEVFKSYCGEKSDGLLLFYDKALDKGKMNFLSFNWLALLLLPAWLGYRRQWSILITIAIMMTALPFIEAFLAISVPNTGIAGGFIAAGLLANSILLMNAQKDFYKLKQKGLDNEEIVNRLKNKISPSIQYAVLGFLGYLALIIGATVLADAIFGLPN
jgi:hypothetical protein